MRPTLPRIHPNWLKVRVAEAGGSAVAAERLGVSARRLRYWMNGKKALPGDAEFTIRAILELGDDNERGQAFWMRTVLQRPWRRTSQAEKKAARMMRGRE